MPEGLNDRRLIFDHALCHALFHRKKDASASLPGWSMEDLIDYHWLLKAELKKRGLKHSGYDELDAVAVGQSTIEAVKLTAQQIGAKSLYLKSPHSMMLWTGEKKVIVKSRSYGGMLRKPLYWGDKDNIYGVLKFTDISAISNEEFTRQQPLHGITTEERKQWWPDGQQLYVYNFKIIKKFRKPKPHVYSRGTQVYFGSPQWKSSLDFVVAVNLDGAIAEVDEDAPIPEAFIEATPKALVKESLEDIAKSADVLIYTTRSPRYYEISAKWLHKNGLPCSQFILGKPDKFAADLNIEDLMAFGDSWQGVAKSVYSARAVYAGLVKSHRRDECMLCKEPPTIEVMWAEGRAHAWFCAKHFESWKRDEGTEQDINDTAKVKYGIASLGWSRGGKRERYGLTKFEAASAPDVSFSSWRKSDVDNLKKQYGIDMPTGEPSFYPGRTWEGIRTSGMGGAGKDSAAMGEIDDVEGYVPEDVDEETLLENHQVTHDWWNAIQSGEEIEHDGATVKALHDAIARELVSRGEGHDTPLIAADLEKMVRQRGNQWCVLHHTGEPIKCWSGPGAHDKALAMHRAILARRQGK